jgi:hypothetical protein
MSERPDWPIGTDPDRGPPCRHCGRQPTLDGWLRSRGPWNWRGAGRPRDYCSNACRQAAYRYRIKNVTAEPTLDDLRLVQLRNSNEPPVTAARAKV